ncbi:hypothetical protein EMWEY_00058080, partial [Eimeria maxima]
MLKWKGSKWPAVTVPLRGTTGGSLRLRMLLVMFFLCRFSLSSASQYFSLSSTGFEVEEAATISTYDVGETTQRNLHPEPVPVKADIVPIAWKKSAWPALGSAAYFVFLVALVTARAFAAAASKDKSLPTVPHENEKKEGEEKEKTTSSKGLKEEGEGRGQKQEQEQGESSMEYAADQLELQQQVRACWLPAQSLGASLNEPISTELLVQLKGHMDAAEQHQSAAEVGDRAAVAAIAAANQAAANDLAALQELVRVIVMTGEAIAFTSAIETCLTDEGFESLVLESTEAARSYQQAWGQVVRACKNSINFQKDDATTIKTQLQSFPPLQQRQLEQLPVRLSAARVAVEGVHRCLKRLEAAKVVAAELRRSSLQLFTNSRLGHLEVVSAKGAVLQKIAFALLKGAKTLASFRHKTGEARDNIGNLSIKTWVLSFKNADKDLSSMHRQMEVLRGAKSLQEAKAAADAAEEAGVHMSKALDGLIS